MNSDVMANQSILDQITRNDSIVDDLVHLTMGDNSPETDTPLYWEIVDKMDIHPFIDIPGGWVIPEQYQTKTAYYAFDGQNWRIIHV